MKIYEDEAFPVFTVTNDENTWPGGITLPEDTFTADEWADLAKATAIYEAWQARLKEIYWDRGHYILTVERRSNVHGA